MAILPELVCGVLLQQQRPHTISDIFAPSARNCHFHLSIGTKQKRICRTHPFHSHSTIGLQRLIDQNLNLLWEYFIFCCCLWQAQKENFPSVNGCTFTLRFIQNCDIYLCISPQYTQLSLCYNFVTLKCVNQEI